MALDPDQIEFINDMAARLDAVETGVEGAGDLAGKLDEVSALAKNFDFGSEIAQLKEVVGQLVGFLGIDLGGEGGAAPQLAAEGGMEKGDVVVELGEHSDARKKDGTNFAAQLMPVPSGANKAPGEVWNTKSLSKSADQPTMLDVMVGISKRLEALEGTTGGRTSAEATGEPIAKAAEARPLFQGRF